MIDNQPMISTGIGPNGKPILFRADAQPLELVGIKFVAAYTRTTPQPAHAPYFTGCVAPNQSMSGDVRAYAAGDLMQVYRAEAAALVAAGIAVHY